MKLVETLFIPEFCVCWCLDSCVWLISGCRQKSWVGTVSSGFLCSQGSHPASRNLKPCVPVEAFLSRSHVDVDGFLECSPGCVGLSITVYSSHLMEWWSFQTCSATADFSRVPLWQASRCSLSFTQELYAETIDPSHNHLPSIANGNRSYCNVATSCIEHMAAGYCCNLMRMTSLSNYLLCSH